MDGDEELERIRKRKMQELLRQQQQQVSEGGEVEERERYEEEKRKFMKQLLTPEARERLARIRLARSEFADQIEDQLIALAQSGRLTRMIDDATFKKILEQFQSRKRDIKIKRVWVSREAADLLLPLKLKSALSFFIKNDREYLMQLIRCHISKREALLSNQIVNQNCIMYSERLQ